jgi:hypothetical protein
VNVKKTNVSLLAWVNQVKTTKLIP